ncbi:hypothetical protein Tco_1320985 [Tanacetum coccineum]
MAPEFWCQTTPTEFWCDGISGAKLHFADVAPLLEFGTKSLLSRLPVLLLNLYTIGKFTYTQDKWKLVKGDFGQVYVGRSVTAGSGKTGLDLVEVLDPSLIMHSIRVYMFSAAYS